MSRLSLMNPFSPLNIHSRICYNNDGGSGGDDNGGVNDDMEFGEAFATARKNKGAGQTFTHAGKSYSTAVAGEDRALDNAMAPAPPASQPKLGKNAPQPAAPTSNTSGSTYDEVGVIAPPKETDYWEKLIDAGESDVSALDALAMPAVNNRMYNFNTGMDKDAVQDYFTTGAGSMGYTAPTDYDKTASGRNYKMAAMMDQDDNVGGTEYYGDPYSDNGTPRGTVMKSGPNQSQVYSPSYSDFESVRNEDGFNTAQYGTLYRNSNPDADGVETTITEPVSRGATYRQQEEAFPDETEEELLARVQANPVAGYSPLVNAEPPTANPIDSSAIMNAMKKINAQNGGAGNQLKTGTFQTGADKELVENYGWTRNADGTASPPGSSPTRAAPEASGGPAAPAKEMSLMERFMATLKAGSDDIPPSAPPSDRDEREAKAQYNIGPMAPAPAPAAPAAPVDPNAPVAPLVEGQPEGSTPVDETVADDIFADADQDGYVTELEADVANLRQQLALLTNTSTSDTQGMSRDQVLAMIQEAMNNNNSSGYNSQTFQNAFGFAPQANYFGQVVPSNISEDGVYERRAVRDKDTGEVRYVNVPIGNASLTGTSGYQKRRREGFGRSIDIF